ncbi:retinitis pigmentosa 1-like 1 protein [Drosophila subpulchrella]|uniref:retinitis pigmentosa 1-like 1 protein n=1 Tax=Drosophila subpulchrella TaxID=1486046 RepID=UPI0018A18B1C|nr:retinitis pigmentosa 1-like 1 protein [Drosophila subpulchrella]
MADMPDLESHESIDEQEEIEATMNAAVPKIPIATGSLKPGPAAPETAATSGKGEKPEIKAEPPSNSYVKGLEKDSKDGESPKKPDSDKQVSVTPELKEQPQALRQSGDQNNTRQLGKDMGLEEHAPPEALRQSGDQNNTRQLGGDMGLEEQAPPQALPQSGDQNNARQLGEDMGLEEQATPEALPQSEDQNNTRQLGEDLGLEEQAPPEALRQSEEEQKQSEGNSLPKRKYQDTDNDSLATPAKKPKLMDP